MSVCFRSMAAHAVCYFRARGSDAVYVVDSNMTAPVPLDEWFVAAEKEWGPVVLVLSMAMFVGVVEARAGGGTGDDADVAEDVAEDVADAGLMLSMIAPMGDDLALEPWIEANLAKAVAIMDDLGEQAQDGGGTRSSAPVALACVAVIAGMVCFL